MFITSAAIIQLFVSFVGSLGVIGMIAYFFSFMWQNYNSVI